jgi:hypothetical protein
VWNLKGSLVFLIIEGTLLMRRLYSKGECLTLIQVKRSAERLLNLSTNRRKNEYARREP